MNTKVTHRIARSAITAGLGLSLALGVCAVAPITARAENGQLTISSRHNAGTAYDAYMVFRADISDDNKATNVQWASTGMKDAVLAFLDQDGYQDWLEEHHDGNGQHDLAQNACEFIAYRIAGSPEDAVAATSPRTTAGRSFANELAQALALGGLSPDTRATAGQVFDQPEGYWLFVTADETTDASGEVGTAPLWVPLGGSTKTIQEKTSVPSVEKQVKEDSTDAWGTVADANVGQNLSYRLTAKLPANFGAFDTYHLKFTDTLSQGLEINCPDVASIGSHLKVTIGSQPVVVDGTHLKATYENNVLTVEFVDLKSEHWGDLTIAGNDAISVEYTAHIVSSARLGRDGNENTVVLTYTEDPVHGGDGTIEPGPSTKTFAYELQLLKVDGQTSEPLDGATFNVQVAPTNSDESSRGLYVQADGSLGQQPAPFMTGSDGSFVIPGIDEGTYLIREVEGPAGYERIAQDITLQVVSTLDAEERVLSKLTATTQVDGQETALISEVSGVTLQTGTIELKVKNNRGLLLPITGQEGLSNIAAFGAILASTAGAGLWWRRRNNH